MAIQSAPQTIIDPSGDPTLTRTEIGLASANGGIFVYQTDKDIYVTSLTETTVNQTIRNVVNEPGGSISGEIQFYQNGNFGADQDFRYDTMTDTLNLTGGLTANVLTVNRTANLGAIANVTITGGLAGQSLVTDGAGHLTWDYSTGTYGNANVAAYLPSYHGDLTPANVLATGNLSGLSVTSSTLTVGGTATVGALTTTGNVTAANLTGAHYGSGNNLSNIQGANVSGAVSFATTANAVAGANVSGTVALATTAGTVSTAAQPNITSHGTLTALAVSGTSNLNAVGNVTITGGTSGQALLTNGSGVLSWGIPAASLVAGGVGTYFSAAPSVVTSVFPGQTTTIAGSSLGYYDFGLTMWVAFGLTGTWQGRGTVRFGDSQVSDLWQRIS